VVGRYGGELKWKYQGRLRSRKTGSPMVKGAPDKIWRRIYLGRGKMGGRGGCDVFLKKGKGKRRKKEKATNSKQVS